MNLFFNKKKKEKTNLEVVGKLVELLEQMTHNPNIAVSKETQDALKKMERKLLETFHLAANYQDAPIVQLVLANERALLEYYTMIFKEYPEQLMSYTNPVFETFEQLNQDLHRKLTEFAQHKQFLKIREERMNLKKKVEENEQRLLQEIKQLS